MRTIFKHKAVVFFGTFFACVLFLATLAYIFSVREIYIEGTNKIENIETYAYAFLPLVKTDVVNNQLYAHNPNIGALTVTKIYPSKLSINVQESDPIAYVKSASGFLIWNDAFRLVAKVIDKNSFPGFDKLTPIAFYQPLHFDEFTIGDVVDKSEIQAAISFLSKAQKLQLPIETIDIASPHMIVLNGAAGRYIISVEKDIELQFQQLRMVHERLSQKGQKYSQIDVRFEKPIISF